MKMPIVTQTFPMLCLTFLGFLPHGAQGADASEACDIIGRVLEAFLAEEVVGELHGTHAISGLYAALLFTISHPSHSYDICRMYTYIHTCMHACMHTYIHTYINYITNIHTYIHTDRNNIT